MGGVNKPVLDLTHLQKLAGSGDVGAMAYLLKYTKFDLSQLDMPDPLRTTLTALVDQFLKDEAAVSALVRVESVDYTAGLILQDRMSRSEFPPRGAYYLAGLRYNTKATTIRKRCEKYYPSM